MVSSGFSGIDGELQSTGLIINFFLRGDRFVKYGAAVYTLCGLISLNPLIFAKSFSLAVIKV